MVKFDSLAKRIRAPEKRMGKSAISSSPEKLPETVNDLHILQRLKARKKEMIIVMLWSVAVALVVIKSYWLTYVDNPILFDNHTIWTDHEVWIPRLSVMDFLSILVISAIAGAILLDLNIVIYSVVITVVLSAVFAITYSSFFIWYTLGGADFFIPLAGWWSWSYAVHYALINIFRMIFPYAIATCSIGALFGAFSRGILQPSAETP